MTSTEKILDTMGAKLARYTEDEARKNFPLWYSELKGAGRLPTFRPAPETMTAAQMIAALRAFPPETPIYRHDYEYGPETIDAVAWDDEYLGPGKVVIS
jgi:hypothetical protein